MFETGDIADATATLAACRQKHLRLVTAESCTGGLIAALLTDVAGSSDVFERGFVTYSNPAKTEMLGVDEHILVRWGAVSEETAIAMAEGALRQSSADIAVSVTGVAGPGGGTVVKPVGLVHLACARHGLPLIHRQLMLTASLRSEVRAASVRAALSMIRYQAAVSV